MSASGPSGPLVCERTDPKFIKKIIVLNSTEYEISNAFKR